MEAAGLGVGVIALASLFNSTVECFEYIQVGRNTNKDFATVTIRLDNTRLRLSRWGEAVGLTTAQKSDTTAVTSPKISKKVQDLLEQIIELFAEAEGVSKRFEHRNKSAKTALQLYDPNVDLSREMQSLHVKMRALALKRQNGPLKSSLGQKTRWALYEEKHFRRLVEDINGLVSDLVELFPAEKIQQKLADVEVSELGREQAFPTLRNVAAEQDKLLEAAIKRISTPSSSMTNNWNNYGRIGNQAVQQTLYGGQTFST